MIPEQKTPSYCIFHILNTTYNISFNGHRRRLSAKLNDSDTRSAKQRALGSHQGVHVCSHHTNKLLIVITLCLLTPNSTATVGNSVHRVGIGTLLTHEAPYMLSAICPDKVRTRICPYPKRQKPSRVSICPLKSVPVTGQHPA